MLCAPVQLSRVREAELRDEVTSLRLEKQELRYNVGLLQEDNQALREETQQLRGKTVRVMTWRSHVFGDNMGFTRTASFSPRRQQ